MENVEIKEEDVIMYGLPDSFYDNNLFSKVIEKDGLVCGLFETVDQSRVDRLTTDTGKFDVKSVKTEKNMNLFWGIIKFDHDSIHEYCRLFTETGEKEVGNIINKIPFSVVEGSTYIDLGTWDSLNIYWSKG